MMLFVVTGNPAVRKAFAAAERNRNHTVEFAFPDRLNEVLRRAAGVPESFCYVDVDGMEARSLRRLLRRLRDRRPYRFGLIDSTGSIEDVAEAFHHAAGDYLGPGLIGSGVTTARLRRVVEFQPPMPDACGVAHVPEHEAHRIILSGSDWSGVRDGHVYTFVMLYAAIDHAGDLNGSSSEAFLASVRKAFSSVIERAFLEYDARTWMWKEDEGLLLLPYDGREVLSIIPALRLILNRSVINAEEFAPYGELSWRLAMHLGNTTYRSSGRTGGIVSESVNFLFHLGSRCVKPGTLAVTEPCHAAMPASVRKLFDHRGEFESVHVYTLRERV